MNAEIARRLENLIRLGTVKTFNPSQPFPTVTVDLGEITTAEIRFLNLRAGNDKTWDPISPGEEVVVLSPCGVLELGIAVAGLNNENNPSISTDPNKNIRLFSDGCFISYDTSSHILEAILPEGGKAVITALGGITLNGDTTINGNLKINGSTAMTGNNTVGGSQLVQGSSHSTGNFSTDADVKAGDISLKSHKTSGVQTGGGTSGGPVP
ncbi:phage-related baseplate protein (GPV-like) [Acinetobacter junii]|uniref:phage baseplate assembly protein V n=1 Tax=Acinetobacter junii TaxID=40215 RepID=UPI0002D112E6|nr:phage baseplate assembly protein V [Acinetobacter junii]ENV67421.1 hypothetical protein F948_00945 [Acinetobacter junii CIP 64.5]SUU19673.1 phage-related baseplate protein (GPV-like) [Acinetobacter junii]SUU22219.1 phage-related baseplate protein (GPV-like) [Acinetobacter junii]